MKACLIAILLSLLIPLELHAFTQSASLGKGLQATIMMSSSGAISNQETARKTFQEGRRVLQEISGGSSGEVAHINKNAGKGMIKASDELLRLFQACMQIYEWTGGLFDVVRSKNASIKDPQLQVSFEKGEISLPEKSTYLDFSKVRVGYAIDRMAGVLRSSGHANFLVKIGENYRTMGRDASGYWSITVPDPREGGRTLCRVSLPTISLSTISSRNSDLQSVTVVTKNATNAVAVASTGIMIGHERAKAMFAKIAAKGFGAILEDRNGKITSIGDVTAACFEE